MLRKPVLDSKGCMREWVKTVKDLERENLTGKAQQGLSNRVLDRLSIVLGARAIGLGSMEMSSH